MPSPFHARAINSNIRTSFDPIVVSFHFFSSHAVRRSIGLAKTSYSFIMARTWLSYLAQQPRSTTAYAPVEGRQLREGGDTRNTGKRNRGGDAVPQSIQTIHHANDSLTPAERNRGIRLSRPSTVSKATHSHSQSPNHVGDDLSSDTEPSIASTTIKSSCMDGVGAADRGGGGGLAGDGVEAQSQSLPLKTLTLAQLYQSSRRSRDRALVSLMGTSSKREGVDSGRSFLEIQPLPFLSADERQPRPIHSDRESVVTARFGDGYKERMPRQDSSSEWVFDFAPTHRQTHFSGADSISSMESLTLDDNEKIEEVLPVEKRRKVDK